MACPDTSRLPRDPAFKAIFSHPRMIADALRHYAVKPNGPLDPRTVAALDFDTLEKLPAEWIGPDFRSRLGDQAWRVRFRWARDWSDPGGYLLILVEFQSQRHPDMALRMASYAMRLYDELEAAGVVRPGAPRPPIFPLVIHNGPKRWTAATTLDGLIAKPALALADAAPAEDVEDALLVARNLEAFQLRHAYFPLDFHPHREDDPSVDNAMSLLIGLESASALDGLLPPLRVLPELAERRLARTMLEWALRRLGVDGETAEEMRRMASLDEFHSQLEETARGWTEQWFAEGVEQGRAEGIERGIERGRAEERALLCRQAARKFDAGTGARLSGLLDRFTAPGQLGEVGDWIIECDTGADLLARVERMARPSS